MPLKQLSSAVLYGLVVILGLAAITSAIAATILRFTSVSESSMSWVILILSFLLLFIGGFIAGGKGKERGLLTGGLTALSYSLIVFLMQYLGYQNGFTTEQLLYHAAYLATAGLGGAAGVNMASKNSK